MTATIEQWPIAAPLTAGDPVVLRVTLEATLDDPRTWEWAAVVREYPRGPVVAQFDVTVDPAGPPAPAPPRILFTLDEERSALLQPWCSFDLRQCEPVDFTWVLIERVNVRYPRSYEATG